MPVIVTRDFPPAHGGIQRYCAGLAGALAANGERVCVVAAEHPGAAAHDAQLPYRVIRVARRGRFLDMLATVVAIRRARRVVDDGRVIAAIWQPCGIEALVAGANGSRWLTIIGHGSEITKQRTGFRRLLAYGVLSRADVVAVSRFTAAAVAQIGAKARVVPGGVTPAPLARARALEPTILTVGRLVRRKGFDRLIEALPELSKKYPSVRLEIVGNGPDRVYLEELAQRLGVSDKVTFLGQIDDRALAAAYARGWLFAMPNRTESGYDVEGLGVVFLEAAMQGMPSIGGLHSGAEDAIVDGVTGFLVEGQSLEQVTEALAKLIDDPSYCDRMGSAARQRVLEEFDWRDIARRVVASSRFQTRSHA